MGKTSYQKKYRENMTAEQKQKQFVVKLLIMQQKSEIIKLLILKLLIMKLLMMIVMMMKLLILKLLMMIAMKIMVMTVIMKMILNILFFSK